MNAPEFDVISEKERTKLEIRDLISKQLEVTNFQIKTSKRQYKLSVFLTVSAIIISLIPLAADLISPKTNYSESIIQLTEAQSKQSELISNMSSRLLDLQNQVHLLEKENEELKLK